MKKKRWVIILIILIILISISAIWWFILGGQQKTQEILGGIGEGGNTPPPKIYSNLTGLEIQDASENSLPTFCIQIPNGSTDGARPQVGLTQASILYEAIAETGITRFAAIFQGADLSMIGPIRSLRPYYLEWDTPYDCTIVHDGGSTEALATVGNGQYRNLDEDFRYMWKVDYIQGQYRYWNNVFTSSNKLSQFNQDHGYRTSNPEAFPRLTPIEVQNILDHPSHCPEDMECTSETDHITADHADTITINFTGLRDYIVHYQYNPENNSYLRSYGNGEAHMSYLCSNSLTNPPEGCELQQIAPKVIISMHVQEHTMSDNYHESIQTTGSGKAEIFQNGKIITGTWEKSSPSSQIIFHNDNGEEINFTPGQIIIEAVPQFGGCEWE